MKIHRSVILFLAATSYCNAFTTQHKRQASIFGVQQQQQQFFLKAEEDGGSGTSVERLPDSAVELTLTVPGAATKASYEKACAEVSKKLTIPGFRKGSKIPPQILEQTLRQANQGGKYPLRAQAIQTLVAKLVEPAIKEQGLDPIGQPSLVIPVESMAEDFEAGKELVMKIKCDVWPEITWKSERAYIGLEGSYNRKPFDQTKMDKALADLKERYATLEPISDADHVLQMGDACVVNMVGYMANEDGVTKGEPLPNAASGDKVDVVLGPGRYMEGLVEGLVGGKVGDTREVKVSFPGALRDKTLAGKLAIFDVEILEASSRNIPEVTDDFAANVRAGLTAESLMEELRKAVDQEDSKEFAGVRNAALAKALADTLNVDIPDTLVTNQAREKYAVMMSDMRENGVSDETIKDQITPENFLKYKDIVKADIIRDFRVSMATEEIARVENIEVPEASIEEQIENIKKDAAKEGDTSELNEEDVRPRVAATLQRQLVMDFLAENADLNVIYEEEQFDEKLMEKLAEESLQRMDAEVPADEVVVEAQSEEVVEEAVVEAVVEEETVAEVEEEAAPVVEEEKEVSFEEKTANMSVEDKALQSLLDLGVAEVSQDPEDPDYDSSKDNEIVGK